MRSIKNLFLTRNQKNIQKSTKTQVKSRTIPFTAFAFRGPYNGQASTSSILVLSLYIDVFNHTFIRELAVGT